MNFRRRVLDDGKKAEFIDNIDTGEAAPRPHLFLLGPNLREKSGAQVLEHMRQSHRCRDVPVVILTSSDSPMHKEQTAQLGAARYFRKPSRLAEFMRLGEIVRELLGSGNTSFAP